MAEKCRCESECRYDAGTCLCADLRSLALARNEVLAAYDDATSELKLAARKAVENGMMKIEVAKQRIQGLIGS